MKTDVMVKKKKREEKRKGSRDLVGGDGHIIYLGMLSPA